MTPAPTHPKLLIEQEYRGLLFAGPYSASERPARMEFDEVPMALSADSPLDTRTVAGVDVVRFPEESLTDERRLVETLDGLGRRLTDPAGARILLDLANVERLSSAGLSKLISLLKKAKANGGSFKLCSLRRPVRDLFEVLRLGMIFEIHDTEEDALEAFGKEMTEEKPS